MFTNNILHPEYMTFFEEWSLVRDCIAGERQIKAKGEDYLPALGGSTRDDYEKYKNRAVFVGLTARTLNGMLGAVFRRPVKILNTTKETIDDFSAFSLNETSFNLFSKKILLEILSIGRVGVLIDSAQNSNRVYATTYLAENILSWKQKIIDGKEKLTYVLLQEESILIKNLSDKNQTKEIETFYRELILTDEGKYIQRLYKKWNEKVQPLQKNFSFIQLGEDIVPVKKGMPLDFIPFYFLGPVQNSPSVERPPLSDIAYLNISHYKTYAQLEHGRYYTALPIYYVSATAASEQENYKIGPSTVWEVPIDAKPGILEYFGTGLSALDKALNDKEMQISQLGGRVMGITTTSVTEAETVYKLKQANEMAVLLHVTDAAMEGLTQLAEWFLWWKDNSDYKNVRIQINQDFKQLNLAARELRAIALLYKEGMFPVSQVFKVLQDAEYLSDDLTEEDFIKLLDNTDAFPNIPAIASKQKGYTTTEEEHKYDLEREKLKGTKVANV